MAVESEDSDLNVRPVKRKVVDFATQLAKKTTTELVQSAGSIAHRAGETMESSARSLNITGEDLVSAMSKSVLQEEKVSARNTLYSGIPSAQRTTTTQPAASAVQTAQQK